MHRAKINRCLTKLNTQLLAAVSETGYFEALIKRENLNKVNHSLQEKMLCKQGEKEIWMLLGTILTTGIGLSCVTKMPVLVVAMPLY